MKQLLILSLVLLSTNTPLFAQYNQWIDAGSMFNVRHDHISILLPNGKVFLLGGNSNTAELFDPVTNTFATTGSSHHNHYQGASGTLLKDGTVLIAGGVNAQNIAELYDPATENFELLDTMNRVHCYHSATLLNDGRVLIAAGQDNNGPVTHPFCEIYDPLTKKFTLLDSLNEDRSSHCAELLPDGRVLIVAGVQTTTPGNAIYLNSCEIFDPSTGKFTRTQNLNRSRSGLRTNLLNNGKVLVSCGDWYDRRGEIFDPLTETWSYTNEMTVLRRNGHTATMLRSGKVLLAGGYIESTTPTAEIYDPTTNSFTAIDSMKVPRMSHVATRLPDGSVLVTGGYNGSDVVSSVEIYLIDTNEVVSVRDVTIKHDNIPDQFALFQNYPNPFNPSTTIKYSLPNVILSEARNLITLKLYDVLGIEIATLVNEFKPTGKYEVVFDAGILPSGSYFYRLQAGSYTETKKMILIR